MCHCRPDSRGGQRPLEAVVCELENDSAHLCLCLRLRKERDFLSISNVNEGDKGTYTCTVRSEIDEDSASARLTVLGTLKISLSLSDADVFLCLQTEKKCMFTKTDLVLQYACTSGQTFWFFFTFEPLLPTFEKVKTINSLKFSLIKCQTHC